MSDFDVSAQIAQLFVYPVKSCAGVEVQEAVLTSTGFKYDREWVLVDDAHRFVSQREYPRMVLIVPSLTDEALVLRAPDMPECVIPFATQGAVVQMQLWDEALQGVDMGDAVAQWLSAFLNAPLRLLRFDSNHERVCSEKWTKEHRAHTMFADGYPLLMISAAAMDDLNTRLAAAGAAQVTALRFRPNIVLNNMAAHDEDLLDDVYIEAAGVQLRNVKPCVRCPIPNIEPTNAKVDSIVTDTLLTYRRNANMEDQPTFGMNAIVVQGVGQVLRVGQAVEANYVF
ncbi:MOSC domain-containing protein [Hydromonas duriensis]|uniref:MOSC domain-containing protein n=1 Tax=Hydromonas duriensis TaxID=1527608 RepID=A0A4R6Y9Z6_9BURK|nr:MOSC N-terminal beta barrel domain-containing protein [Hydromonas duriensis]TDR32318.1 hypothetical protein DFR44_10432 [Hydromonas duriensis]